MRFFILCALATAAFADDFSNPPNTERAQGPPLPAQAAAAAIKLPPGFRATAFAAEPDVQQPIAMAIDARGRLWVAECYTYAEGKVNFDTRLRDRIVIFEDVDNDGHFDTRKIFWDQGQRLTSIELGFGGVWVTCAPNFLFIPDRDGDDIPDGAPEILLDGFDADRVRHNIVNGLRWGPDGWLYGRHGIQNYSFVGKPGAPTGELGVRGGQRKKLSCCIWRFHPTRRTFEVVAEGTTNPWGLDWNEIGEGFFTNTVIGHLWHLIPGAHYRRMYGEDLNPHVYRLMEQCADHFHWDTGQDWAKSRASDTGRVSEKNDTLGGGHAHCGCLIYQGEMFPQEWRGKVLTLNFHGRRINVDRLERQGSGYVGKHERDFAFFGDPWFRGIDLIQAPDGGIYVSDWSDAGECHEEDGVHRSSGRIFKITYAPSAQASAPAGDAARRDPGSTLGPSALPREIPSLRDEELVQLQLSRNEWLARVARRVIQERAAKGADITHVKENLWTLFQKNDDTVQRSHLLHTLHAIGGVDNQSLRRLLDHKDPVVRASAVRFLAESEVDDSSAKRLAEAASQEPDPFVRLHFASALQRIAGASNSELALALLAHAEDAEDANLPLMIWYGVERFIPGTAKMPMRLASSPAALSRNAIPLVRRLVARRLAEGIDDELCASLLDQMLLQARDYSKSAADVALGMADGLRGRRKAPKLPTWASFELVIRDKGDRALNEKLRALSALFGDGRALEEIRGVALDGSADFLTRRAALQTLIDSRDAELRAICEKTIGIRELATTAARGLATFDDWAAGEMLVKRHSGLWAHDRPELISVMVSRPSFARALLAAVGEGRIPRTDISAFHARQIMSFDDVGLTKSLREVWGEIRTTDASRRATITKLEKELTAERLLQADRRAGRLLFNQTCATCHRLFGEGGQVGPDLTGSDRGNLHYLLENIVDPNAIVPVDARMSVVTLKDGRVLTGIVGAKTERTLTVRGLSADVQTLERADIARIEESPQSLMPEHLMETLSDDQVRDLISYVMSKEQVALPGG